MRDRLDHLFQHCADLDIPVEWADLGSRRRGHYRSSAGIITLSTRLTQRQAIGALAHEIGHERFSDRCSTPASERRAWEFGAAFLITPDEYRAAEDLVGEHPNALALELDVTPRLIEGWRRWWLTRGQFLDDDVELDV